MEVGPYLTYFQLTGEKISVSMLLERLSKIARSDVLRCLSRLLILINRESSFTNKYQLQLLHAFTSPDFAKKVEELLVPRQFQGTLFFRRQIWFLWQMALIACKDDSTMQHNEETAKSVGECLIMSCDVMQDVEIVQPIQSDEKKTLRFIATTMISHGEKSSGGEIIARCFLFWLDLQKDERVKRSLRQLGMKPITESFEERYSIPLNEFIYFATTLYSKFVESAISDPPSALMFDSACGFSSYFTKKHKDAALKLLSTTPDSLAIRLLGTPRQSWALDTSVLEKFPLLEMKANQFACFDLSVFRDFLVHGIFELLADAIGYDKMKSLFGKIFEEYFSRLMTNFSPPSEIIDTPFFEGVVFAANKNQEACDGLLLGSRWLFYSSAKRVCSPAGSVMR